MTYEFYEDAIRTQDFVQEYYLYDRYYKMKIQNHFLITKIVKTSVNLARNKKHKSKITLIKF